ncbi:MAG: hypothetical protein CMJ49_06660 [Planctomycetaceae bacterium]|nr:hypothetical protein [Planctomycetaceae bacterium]
MIQDQAIAASEAGAEEQVPDRDRILLEVIATDCREGRRPTPSEVLAAARKMDPSELTGCGAGMVTRCLKKYGIAPPRKSNNRREFRDINSKVLHRIEQRYGIDLGFGSDDSQGDGASDKPSQTSLPSLETGDGKGRGQELGQLGQ